MVVGNQKGSIGIGQGKSKQVPDAIKKATEVAKRNRVKIPLKRKNFHDVREMDQAKSFEICASRHRNKQAVRSDQPEVLRIQDVGSKIIEFLLTHTTFLKLVKFSFTKFT